MYGKIKVKVQLLKPTILNGYLYKYDEFRCDSIFDAIKFVSGFSVYDSLNDCMQRLDFNKYCPVAIDNDYLLGYEFINDLIKIYSEKYIYSYDCTTDTAHLQKREV